jgi:hypothetical protein
MRFLLRVIAMMVAMYAALTMVRRLLGAFTPAAQVPAPTPIAQSGHLVKDPVCGMYVPEATAIHAGNAFFCSEECRKKFVSSTD